MIYSILKQTNERLNMKILTKSIKDKLIDNHKNQDGSKSFKAVLKLLILPELEHGIYRN